METFIIPAIEKRKTSVQQNQSHAVVLFDSCGIVYREYALQGQTITKEHYLEVMCHLHDAVWPKRPAQTWQLQQ